MRLPRPRGLRSRLVAAFVLVTVAAAGAAAWSSARSASGALVEATQRQLIQGLVDEVDQQAPTLTYPPDQQSLDRLRTAIGPGTLVVYRDRRSVGAEDSETERLIDDGLRARVESGDRLLAQRVEDGGTPYLVLGTPVLLTRPDGSQEPSGIEVYALRDLTPVARQVDHVSRSALSAAALVLPAAVLLALLAARTVLRPVRDLRDTANRLAGGDLDARSPPRGADELAELTTTINAMATSLQGSMTEMDRRHTAARRFVADVSHELRTPLAALTAVAEVLADTVRDLEPDARESAALAVTETARLVRLVEDLMEVSRFDAGTADLRAEPIDLVAAVRDSLRVRGWLDLVAVVAPAELCLAADPRRIDVIVTNLVGNALRHGAPPVEVHLARRGRIVTVTVSDLGPGLPAELRSRVFDRFYKADAGRTRSAGSGLGLSIALANARLHGGDLEVTEPPSGRGACFVLTLPAGPETEA